MNTLELDKLNKDFSFADEDSSLNFELGKGNLAVVRIKNRQASACISLQGAHLLSWVPVDEDEVFWVSDKAIFSPAKPVRGGIPICWPWFGAHEDRSDYPAHGFARNELWQVKEARQVSEDISQITFRLDTSIIDRVKQTLWPWPTLVECRFEISNSLTIEINTINNSEQPITLGQALHSYFNIGDITQIKIFGLENKQYLDKTQGSSVYTQSGPVTIDSEVDRVYLQTEDEIIIDNNKRKIVIAKQGSKSTIVWNPWKDVAAKMTDMDDDGYVRMLCVEPANAADDTVSLAPGESHSLVVTYSLK